MDTIIFSSYIVLGYLISWFIAGKEEGGQGLIPSIKWRTKKNIIHVHHWVYWLAALVLVLILDFGDSRLAGLLAGFVLQGLSYSDRFRFIYPQS